MLPIEAKEVPASVPETRGAGSPRVEFAIGVLNGVVGDYLHRQDNGLATPMELIHDGRPLRLDRESLQRAYPHSRGRLTLWVHGLAVTEAVWAFPGEPSVTYGALLERDLGFTPLYLRYNTGLHISDNGESLARLLEELVAAFPVPVEELVLMGYSMGGLVVRSACHVAAEAGHTWLSRVRRAFYIGVPHLGSPLERVGNAVSWVLRKVPNAYTQLIADVVDLRSNGVKDLGMARLLRRDWDGAAVDVPIQSRCHPVPLLPGISHHLLVGALAARERHLLSVLFGDGVVPLASASGRAGHVDHDLRVPPENVRVLTGIHHVALAHDAQCYAGLRAWFEEASP
ncbi:esterase/lipase family protein [Pyxidicoccus xibeiensis]|uniref:esterase/lipase family protein n=1 Tax=Pyxidicoccus xibeiensis TaxID=2906759 RepID=UPI0020A8153E|nr:alpha/beta hydrolase [Pyxidicoccus xibeiensis]MCP3143691.1 alpha/beta hydrolase [Pyxidicoccus xibeiensis]